MTEDGLAKEAALFPVKKALQYMPLRPIDSDGKGCLGETFYLAPNPPFGAVFTYYLKDGLKSAAEARREAEAKLVKDGKPVPFPGWDALRREENEPKPAVILTSRTRPARSCDGSRRRPAKGFHRVAWNLRYPGSIRPSSKRAQRESWEREPRARWSFPGKFTVTLAKKVDGVTDAARRAANVRRRIARPGQPAGKGQGRPARFPEEGRRAATGDDGRRRGGRGRAEEPDLHQESAARRAQGRPEADRAARAIEKRIQDQIVVLFGI